MIIVLTNTIHKIDLTSFRLCFTKTKNADKYSARFCNIILEIFLPLKRFSRIISEVTLINKPFALRKEVEKFLTWNTFRSCFSTVLTFRFWISIIKNVVEAKFFLIINWQIVQYKYRILIVYEYFALS